MSRREVIVAALTAATLMAFLYVCGGGSKGWDELLYMHTSLNPSRLPHIWNRYSHIYLQRACFLLRGDAFLGAHLLWSLVISATALMTYACARLLGASRMGGILAAWMFLAYHRWANLAGVTLIDFTTMLLATGAVLSYLVYHSGKTRGRGWLLVAFGALLFFTVKSKETGLFLLMLVPGFVQRDEKRIGVRATTGALLLVVVGGIVAAATFTVLDWQLLGDPWFWLRPGSADTLVSYYTGWLEKSVDYYSYIGTVAEGSYALPFTLYFLVGFLQLRRRWSFEQALTWLLPIALLAFLTLTMVPGTVPVLERYLFPCLPVLCIWGGQLIDPRALAACVVPGSALPNAESRTLQPPLSRRAWLILPCVGVTVLAIAFLEIQVFKLTIPGAWQNGMAFHLGTVVPSAVMLLWLALLFLKEDTRVRALSISLCVLAVLSYPSVMNVLGVAAGNRKARGERRFYPLKVFGSDMRIGNGVRYYITDDMHLPVGGWMLSRDVDSSMWMFNL